MPRKAVEENYAEVYREAAKEHRDLSLELHEARRYVMSHYLAGLAVECILRAYHYRLSSVFSGRHDLQTLYRDAQFAILVLPDDEERVTSALTEVVRRWSNSHRFRSEQALRLYLRRSGLGRTGTFVRESSRRIVDAAIVIVDLGVLKWNV
jgi:HEPN domain-containing protein